MVDFYIMEIIVGEEEARQHWKVEDVTLRRRMGWRQPWKPPGIYEIVFIADQKSSIRNAAEGDVIVIKRRGDLTDKRLKVLRRFGLGLLEIKDLWWEGRE